MRAERLKAILRDSFGHSDFRFDQQKVIESVLDGEDTVAIMPTGGGKSACYQVPALFSEGLTLVISPLISLMHDQVMNLSLNGITGCYLNSSQSYEEKLKAQKQIESGEAKIVYVSPEGLISGNLVNFLQKFKISLIAIDEAHCVSQWGHEFRADYMKLGSLKETFPKTPVLALTATADARTRKDISLQLNMNSPNVFVSSFDRPNIKYKITERIDELKQLEEFINLNHEGDTGIVYCLSRKKVEKVTEVLKKRGFPAVSYHAGLSAEIRSKNQKLFNTQDYIIVVATIAFGMGIDRPDVRFVAHLDLPKSIESYYQETGRAGRDGNPSSAWMVYGLQDVIKLSQMLETTDASELYKQQARHKLDSMLSLCETVSCRRQYLLNYFAEQSTDYCGSCDSCLEPAEKIDASIEAQKILSAIYRTDQVFGAGYIIDIVRGSKSAKIIERNHDKLSCYGIGKDKDKNFWNILLRQLLNLEYIRIKNWEYRNLALTDKAGSILRGEEQFLMKKIAPLKSSTNIKKRAINEIEASHGNLELFEALRQLRRELSEEENVPPYVVFNDKSLHDMCQLLPRNNDEFLMVNGVGSKKCEKYGGIFLQTISGFLN